MTQYETKSKNLIEGILNLVDLLGQTNTEIELQIEANKAEAEHSKQRIEQLGVENEELAKVKADNEAFVAEIKATIERFKNV